MDTKLDLIPDPFSLRGFLEIDSCIPQDDLIFSKMLDPLKEVLSSNGKRIRSNMVRIGFHAFDGMPFDEARRQLQVCEQIIEALHLGSMIIDDIQDHSELRRGKPTFHRVHGIGVALNAANWLYFQAIQQVQALRLELNEENALQRKLNEVLLKAHLGQGIDIGVNQNTLLQTQVEAAYLTTAELKTGGLMALAFELGAIVARSVKDQRQHLLKITKKFGIALQMLDDIGNYLAPPPKTKEDLKLGRPSFVRVIAAKISTFDDYQEFTNACQLLPNNEPLNIWNNRFNLISQAKICAVHYLTDQKNEFFRSLPFPSIELEVQVEMLFQKLENAYG